MNIGIDAKRAYCNYRGLGNYSRDTIRIMTTHFPEENFYLFTPQIRDIIVSARQSNSTVICPKGIYSHAPFSSLWRTSTICKDIKHAKIDLYHGLSHELPYGIRKTGTKTVVTMHDVIFLKNPELFPFFDRHLFKKKYLHGCEAADRIVAISQQTQSDLIEYIGVDADKIDIVYQGCNPIFRQPIEEKVLEQVKKEYQLPSEYMLIVCAIERRKNHELILKAMRNPKIELPLVIVGRGEEYKKELIEMAEKWKIGKRLIFLEAVKTEVLPAIYKLATLFVYPSLFEGFGIPILEALTTGTPVITSKGSCFKETGGEAALYVSCDEEEELSSTILQILENKNLQEKMIEDGYKHAQLFSDEAIARNLMNVYKKVLSY